MEHNNSPIPTVVLVVDDDVLVQMDLAQWLRDHGLTVLTADNAAEAISVLNSRSDIAYILTDIQMPGLMDGIQLAHHAAEHWPPIKIIVMSGLCATQLCALPPGSWFLPKPVDRAKLWEALSAAPGAPISPPARLRSPPRFGCA
jgi:CheY-like chemotaxis protein